MLELNGLRIVKLERDLSDFRLKTGDYGVLWVAYGFNPPLYEATFIDCDENESDATFDENDVEEVLDVSNTPHLEKFKEIYKSVMEFEAKLENKI